MGSRARLAVVAVAVAGVGAAGVLLGGSSPPQPRTPFPDGCLTVPTPIPTPTWYPDDLPLPDGSHAGFVIGSSSDVRRIVMVVDGDLDAFVAFVLDRWPKEGWQLGVGEREPGEAEDTFIKGQHRFGKFRARSVYCDETKTELLLEMVLDGRSLPTPS